MHDETIPASRVCCRCLLSFPRTIDYWYRKASSTDGFSSSCRDCTKQYNHEKYHQKDKHNPDTMERRRERGRQWYRANTRHSAVKTHVSALKRRARIFDHYGTECACCGEPHDEFLTIDHINGHGREHRAEIKVHLYIWLIRENFPPGFRTLCWNCNVAIGKYGYCPHGKIAPVPRKRLYEDFEEV